MEFNTIIQIALFFLVSITMAAYLSLFERKLIARIQLRVGPNNCGIIGIFQPIADALKLFFKMNSLKNHSRQSIFGVFLLFFISLIQLTFIPITNDFVILTSDYSLLIIIPLHMIMVFSETLIGISSKSKYGVLGGGRAYIQTLGSHIPFILLIIIIFLITKTLDINKIALLNISFFTNPILFIVFLIFFIVSLILSSHIPFDFVEAESELVGGAYLEYGGILFGIIYLCDYLNLMFISALTATIFLGGYNSSIFPESIALSIKTISIISIIILIRAILPRYKQDQMIKISWLIFTPILLFYILIIL